MEIDLDPTKSVVPPIPDGFVLRPYKTSDEPELLGAINQVFDPDPFYSVMTLEHFRASFVRDPGKTADALWQLLWSGHDLVAFSLGFSEHHGDREVGEIRSVGVREAWRRRGLGEIVVRACFRALHERGLRRVTLGVDASNPTGAVQFYESLGMHVAARGDNWAIDLP
jgi:mycothiol synthase